MAGNDESELAAAALTAAEIVTAERSLAQGAKRLSVPDGRSRFEFWHKTLRAIRALDPYDEDDRRAPGGVQLKWIIWALYPEADSDDSTDVPSTAWDRAYEIDVSSHVVVNAFGGNVEDLGTATYDLRSTKRIHRWRGITCASMKDESPDIFVHRKSMQALLAQVAPALDAVVAVEPAMGFGPAADPELDPIKRS